MQFDNRINNISYTKNSTRLSNKFLSIDKSPFKVTVSGVGMGSENPETGEKIYASYDSKDDYVYTKRETADGRVIERNINVKNLDLSGADDIQKLAYETYMSYKNSQNIHSAKNQKEDININKKLDELKSDFFQKIIENEYSKMKEKMLMLV